MDEAEWLESIIDEAHAEGAAEMQASIVKWLDRHDGALYVGTIRAMLHVLARQIERGEHLKNEADDD